MKIQVRNIGILPENCPLTRDPSSVCVLDIETTGRYFRNTRITRLSVLSFGVPDAAGARSPVWYQKDYLPASQEEEFEALQLFGKDLKETVLTFNGQAFDLPYLRNKLKAYALADPLPGRTYHDLMLRYRSLAPFLSLPGYHLADFAEFLGCGGASEAAQTLMLLKLESYVSFFSGAYEFLDAGLVEGSAGEPSLAVFTMRLSVPAERETVFYDDPFRLRLSGDEAVLSAAIRSGCLKRFYPDYQNYEYLPLEGYAVHKSLASLIPKSRRQKAVRETSFQLIPSEILFPHDESSVIGPDSPSAAQKKEERQKAYLSSAIDYLKLPLSLPEPLLL